MASVALIAVAATPTRAADAERFEVTYLAAFVVILAIALVAQALMLKWRAWFPGAEGEKSLIRGVRAAACSIMSLI